MLSAFLLIFGSIWLTRLSIASQKEDKTEYEKLRTRRVVLYLTILIILLQSALVIPLLNNIDNDYSTIKAITLISILIGFLPLIAVFIANTLQKYMVVIISIGIQAALGILMIIGLQVTIGINQIFSVLFTILVIRMLLLEKKLIP